MINLLVGTGALPEGPVRWELEIDGPDMRAKYKRNGVVIETGRMLNNEERDVYDSDMGSLERTGIILSVQGPGQCVVGLDPDKFVDCTIRHNLRFYRIPKKV